MELLADSSLSRKTVSLAVKQLVDAGVVEVADSTRPGRVGPAAERLRLSGGPVVGGVDLGRRHVTVALGNSAGSIIETMAPKRLDADLDPRSLAVAAARFRELIRRARIPARDVATVGLSIAAPLAHDGRIASSDYAPGWPINPLGPLFAKELRKDAPDLAPVVLPCNDANMGAIGEVVHGSAQGAETALFLKASSGIGLGIWLAGKLFTGGRGFAGEFGHTAVSSVAQEFIANASSRLLSRERRCLRCGQLTCLENLCSSTAVVEQLKETYPNSYSPETTFADIVQDAVSDPVRRPLSMLAMDNLARRLGSALGDLTRIFDPDVIVIGGFMATAEPVISGRIVETVVAASLDTGRPEIRYVPRKDIEYTEARGALALALERTKLSYDETSRTVVSAVD
ncbi:MAG TPA: ROK family protein [Solirubrobacteraceae bacterium]|jgi:predicted NBD/HSP70 family sugar kinase